MTTTSSTRTRNSAAAGKRTVTNDVSAQSASPSTGFRERVQEIAKTIWESMSKLTDVDWSRETPGTIQAQADLEEQMALYAENKVSRAEVKAAYLRFRDAHKGGLF